MAGLWKLLSATRGQAPAVAKGVSAKFLGPQGAAALISPKNFQKFVSPSGNFGRPPTLEHPQGAAFVAPFPDLQALVQHAGGNRDQLTQALGLNHGSFDGTPSADTVMLAHVPAPAEHGLRAPTATTPGANNNFVPATGAAASQTSGGMPEAIVNQLSSSSVVYMPSDQSGLVSHAPVRFFPAQAFQQASSAAQRIMTALNHDVSG